MNPQTLYSARRPVFPALLFVLAFALLFSSSSTPAARAADPVILRVTTSGENGGDTCGTSWDTPCSLQQALIYRADTSSGATYQLWVAAGTYQPGPLRADTFQLKNGVALYGGFAGGETELSQRDIVGHATILSGDVYGDDSGDVSTGEPTRSDNSYHVVTGSGTNNTAVLDGFTVRDGNANGTAPDTRALGGGMYNYGGSPTLTNVTFTTNSAWFGAGMLNDQSITTLTSVTFIGNAAYTAGGMYSIDSKPILTNVTFSGNAAYQGGGMVNIYSDTMLTNVTFSGNHATYGGGMINTNAAPTLTNVTFSSNSGSYGGAVYNQYSSPTLRNVTFRDNSAATSAGGMYNATISGPPPSSPIITNTIFWSYTAPTAPQIVNDTGSTPSISYSVIQGGCPLGSTCDSDTIVDADPLLGPLADYGGATQTIPLLPGSSAIDAGDYATCTSAPVSSLDQRGILRVDAAGHCDIGAYESRGFTFSKTGGSGQSASLNTSFALPLETTFSETGGSGLPGVVVTYTAPVSGPSATWSGSTTVTQTTGIGGMAGAPPPTATGDVGSYPVTASAPGVSSPLTFTLTNLKASTTTTLASSANPSVSGQSVTFTASVTGASPTGSVTFKDGGTDISGCVARPLSGTSATCTAASLSIGTHAVAAVYGGDAHNGSSTSSVLSQVVNKANTTTAISSSPNPSTVGGSVVFTVTVSAVAPASGTPSGTVELYETSSPSMASRSARRSLAAQPLVNGVATFTATSLDAGTHTVLAVYSGDAVHNASTSSLHSHVVGPTTIIKLYLPLVRR